MTDNELIAEFMGLSRHNKEPHLIWVHDHGYACFVTKDKLLYHTSWDWLIPVVEKIQSIDIEPAPNYRGYRIEIVVQGYVKISGFPMPSITTNVAGEGSLIAAVYKAVVEFIKFYNTQK